MEDVLVEVEIKVVLALVKLIYSLLHLLNLGWDILSFVFERFEKLDLFFIESVLGFELVLQALEGVEEKEDDDVDIVSTEKALVKSFDFEQVVSVFFLLFLQHLQLLLTSML